MFRWRVPRPAPIPIKEAHASRNKSATHQSKETDRRGNCAAYFDFRLATDQCCSHCFSCFLRHRICPGGQLSFLDGGVLRGSLWSGGSTRAPAREESRFFHDDGPRVSPFTGDHSRHWIRCLRPEPWSNGSSRKPIDDLSRHGIRQRVWRRVTRWSDRDDHQLGLEPQSAKRIEHSWSPL